MTNGRLFLIPSFLGESVADKVFPAYNAQVISLIRDFIVEDERTARRFLKKINTAIDLSGLEFYILNEHTHTSAVADYLTPALSGRDLGLISEAGMPCIADPGAGLVNLAHEKRISVVPLVGPSSIFLALAASGFNGQQFIFHGYLPVEKNARIRKIKEMEHQAAERGLTQIFMETPYRNMALLDALLRNCKSNALLCIACNLTLQDEFISTKSIQLWQKNKPDLNKRPAIFLMGR